MQEQPAESHQPEAEGVQPRKRHVPCADHQRHEVVGEPEHERHRDEEDHRRAVHGEQAVEHLGRDDRQPGRHQLDAHARGLYSTDEKEHEGVADVHKAEALVIDRRDPAVKAIDERSRRDDGLGQRNRIGRHRGVSDH